MMLTLEQVSVGYRKNMPLLEGVNLSAGRGEMVALAGRNGTGKSTLLRSLLGIIPLLGGRCLLNGEPLDHYDHRARARMVSYVSSRVASLPSLTVRELVSLGRIPYTGWLGKQDSGDRLLVEQAVIGVGLEGFLDRNLDRLSDGERQRVMIARAMVQDTPVMVLDEPAAYLDIPNKYELVRILADARDRDKTIIFSTHDLETAMVCADKFWVIDEGRIHDGAPEDLGMSGLFDRLFEQSGIGFDRETGRFRYGTRARGTVSLEGGPEQALYWTRNALARIGFSLVPGNSEFRIEVDQAEGTCRWKVSRGSGEQKKIRNLYSLAKYLTEGK
jgi:iron complex transport system ATP-binding protein